MQHIHDILIAYGLLAVFVNVLLDDAGVPVPSAPILIVAGASVANGELHLLSVWGAAVAGACVADNGWYWAARRYGRRVLSILCRVSLSPDSCVRKTESLFTRIGPVALLISKFVPGLDNVTIALCGVTKVSPAVFLPLELSGATLNTGVFIFVGILFHDAATAVIDTLAALGKYGVGLICLALAVYLTLKWWERHAFARQLRMDRISVDELAAMLKGDGVRPLVLDVRPASIRLRDGIIPGAVPGHTQELESSLGQVPRDAEIIIYCACPNEASAALAAIHLKRAGFKRIRPLLGGVEAWSKAGHPMAFA